MAVRQIVYIPDPVLRRKARKVTLFDADLKALIDDMVETLREAPGVGLAAPQIGISERIIVVEYGKEDENGEEVGPKKLYAVINPEIVEAVEETEIGVEGCLSVPDLVGEVERSLKIVIKGKNKQVKPIKIKAEGWLARIFQHEIDHLEGVIFTDRATKVWKPTAEEKETIKD